MQLEFSKNTQISNFMKIRPVGAELFHADGRKDRQKTRRTHMTKLTVAFRNFANAPKRNALYWDPDNLFFRHSVRDLPSATESSARFSWYLVQKAFRAAFKQARDS